MLTLSEERCLVILRVCVSLLLVVHGIARIQLGMVDPFGSFLDAQGFGVGLVLAWGITVVEVIGGLGLALGKARRFLAGYFALQLFAGIVLVHAQEGWFVVGAGRNGMEYSVLLIVALVLVGFSRSSP